MNPRSGSIRDPDVLVRSIRSRCDELSVHPVGDHDAAVASGPDRLLVAGGDGTMADCFAAAARASVQLAPLPAGTANDFVRALDLPLDLDKAIERATDPAAPVRATWGGTIAGRPFVNVASVGLAVDAAEYATRLKRKLGPAAYVAGALRAGVAAHPVRARLAVDEASVADGRVWQLLIGATGRFGGGAGLGEADAADPSLVAAWVPSGPRITLPVRAIGLRNRTIERQDGVRWWRGRRLVAEATQHGHAVAWNIDGERWDAPPGRVEITPLGPVDVVVGGP